jgi:hypothetical protein
LDASGWLGQGIGRRQAKSVKYFLYIAGVGLAAFGLVDILHAVDLVGVPTGGEQNTVALVTAASTQASALQEIALGVLITGAAAILGAVQTGLKRLLAIL